MSVTTRQIATLLVLAIALGLAAACGIAACEACESGQRALSIDLPPGALARLGAICCVGAASLILAVATVARSGAGTIEVASPVWGVMSPMRI